MKKLINFLGLLLITTTTFGQITVDQSIVKSGPYKVGDTLSIKYNVIKGAATPRYFWLRYQYNNKALELIPNSTVFGQGSSTQTFYTGWNNYIFTPKTTIDDKNLYSQYVSSPWTYTVNSNWNVGQLTVQRTDASIDGVLATQNYIVKDVSDYSNIHKLDLAYAIDATGANVATITTTNGPISLGTVTGGTSQFKVRVLYPSTYTNISDHVVQLMYLDANNNIDWTKQPITVKQLDGSGEAIFTSGVKIGDKIGVFVGPAFQKPFMNNIVTVSDAYKAFLGVSQTDINGTATYFTYPTLEKKVGNVTMDTTFNESDSYYLFAYVMGIDVSSNARIPSSTSTQIGWTSGLLNQSWLDGLPKNSVTISSPNQTVDMVYAWTGDLDWSHSSSPIEIASRISTGNYANKASDPTTSMKTMSLTTMSYVEPVLEKTTLSVTSTLENGKVVLTTSLSKSDLAGLQVIMNYDNTKLTLDNVIFDSGSTVTNFSTHDGNRLTFGSIDQIKTARIKSGTPYKLVFTPKVPLTNTAGLFYFVLSDAVDANGKKIDLVVE